MRTVTVNKGKLIKAMEENRLIHKKEYEEVIKEYKDELQKRLKKTMVEIKNKHHNFPHGVFNDEPKNNINDYERVISMLYMSIDNTIELTQDEYNNYVLDNWSWKDRFELSKSTYMKG